MNKIDHIQNSIENAKLEKSKLTDKILSMEGFSSKKIRHLLNNLLNFDRARYLEIGTYKGSTFASALYKNPIEIAYAIDNWTEFSNWGNPKAEFLKNTDGLKFEFFEEDCYRLDLNKIKSPINVYLYDGAHTYESQFKALEYFYPILDDEFIFIVDDFDPVPNWYQVEKGTRDSIEKLNLKTLFEEHLKSEGRNDPNTWWNGYFVSLLKK